MSDPAEHETSDLPEYREDALFHSNVRHNAMRKLLGCTPYIVMVVMVQYYEVVDHCLDHEHSHTHFDYPSVHHSETDTHTVLFQMSPGVSVVVLSDHCDTDIPGLHAVDSVLRLGYSPYFYHNDIH